MRDLSVKKPWLLIGWPPSRFIWGELQWKSTISHPDLKACTMPVYSKRGFLQYVRTLLLLDTDGVSEMRVLTSSDRAEVWNTSTPGAGHSFAGVQNTNLTVLCYWMEVLFFCPFFFFLLFTFPFDLQSTCSKSQTAWDFNFFFLLLLPTFFLSKTLKRQVWSVHFKKKGNISPLIFTPGKKKWS